MNPLGKLSIVPAICDSSDIRGAQHLPLTYRRCFAELLSSYPDYTAVYTDGSFVHESTGSAFMYDDKSLYRLYNFNSFFTAELYTLYRALLFIGRHTRQYHLTCTDSLSSLQSPNSCSPHHPISNEILTHLPTFPRQTSLLFYCATLACPATRPLMVQLKQPLCAEPSLLIEISALK